MAKCFSLEDVLMFVKSERTTASQNKPKRARSYSSAPSSCHSFKEHCHVGAVYLMVGVYLLASRIVCYYLCKERSKIVMNTLCPTIFGTPNMNSILLRIISNVRI